MSNGKTIADIIAEARDKYTVHDCTECNWRKCCLLAARGFGSAECLEKRESIALALGIEDGYFQGLLNRLEAAWKRESVTAAKLCEALLRCDAIAQFPETRELQSIKDMRNIISAALKAPPRNCDVGTAAEQTRRMEAEYCTVQKSCYESPDGRRCPLYQPGVDCRLVWAQMRYKKGDVK